MASKTSAYSSMPAWAEKIPAHPQAASLVSRACGALSVPRKKRASPEAAGRRSAIPAHALPDGQARIPAPRIRSSDLSEHAVLPGPAGDGGYDVVLIENPDSRELRTLAEKLGWAVSPSSSETATPLTIVRVVGMRANSAPLATSITENDRSRLFVASRRLPS